MKFTARRTELMEALAVALAAAPTRTPKDILKYVKLSASGEQMTLLATDQEIELQTSMAVENVRPGSCLVNQKLLTICRETTNETVTVEADGGKIEVFSGLANWTLQTDDPESFPGFSEGSGDTVIEVPLDRLRQAINLTVFACDPDSARYALGGVLFALGEGRLDLVATDSRRLSVCYVCEAQGKVEGTVVPARACQILSRMEGDKVTLAFSTNSIKMSGDGWKVSARLVEGRFPRHQDVLPREGGAYDVDLVLTVGPAARLVRQAQIVHEKGGGSADFIFEDGNLSVTSLQADVGSSKSVMPIPYDGEAQTVTLDTRYVMDLLKRLPDEDAVELRFNKDTPTYWRSESVMYVLMPLANEDR